MIDLKAAVTHASQNWKTTVQSVLTVVVSLTGGLTVAPNPWISTTLAAKLFGAGAIAKVILGALQSDGIQVPGGSTVKQTTTITTPEAK